MKNLFSIICVIVASTFILSAIVVAGERTTISMKNLSSKDVIFYVDQLPASTTFKDVDTNFQPKGRIAGGEIKSNAIKAFNLNFTDGVYVTAVEPGSGNKYSLHLLTVSTNVMLGWNGEYLRRLSGDKLPAPSSRSF